MGHRDIQFSDDALNLASPAPAAETSNPQRARAIGAFANIAAITALDIVRAPASPRRRRLASGSP